MCGADNRPVLPITCTVGSPPRVRSRLTPNAGGDADGGITSACAEQTCAASSSSDRSGDHLRVCGADLIASEMFSRSSGSPPRVRSRPRFVVKAIQGIGITSACAEQTCGADGWVRCFRDHLRVCGADIFLNCTAWDSEGSPPRVRSRRTRALRPRPPTGITSACAEQTLGVRTRRVWWWDHLRVCGADHWKDW